jgi:signal transduction histidine kinase
MLAVVLSFSASLAVSHLRLRPMEEQALDIVRGATPSLEHLSAVRTELRRLGMYVNEHVADIGNGRTVSGADIDAARHQLDADLMAYRNLPSFPGEAARLAEIDTHLSLLQEAMHKLLNEADAGSVVDAKATLREAFHPRLERTDDLVAELKTLKADHVRDQAEAILTARRAALVLAAVLGIASLGVAIMASLLVVRALSSRARLMEEHSRLLAARASELEAFAGRVAHDLKSPLGAVALRILSSRRRYEMTPPLRENLDKVARQIERMDQIINGLLEFARAGANPSRGARVDLNSVLDEVITDIQPAADAVNAQLHVGRFSPTQLACSPEALASVLSNLLGNAVKYIVNGKRVPRQIAVYVEHRDDVARIEIEDTGPGLPPGSEEFVFEPFCRLPGTSQTGIGLGLATVKKIVEAYDGRVGVRSRLGEGSTFWFEVPRVRVVAQRFGVLHAQTVDRPQEARP